MLTSINMKEINLPNLPGGDIAKLDQLLSFMKENNTEFIDIYKVCKKKWGDNKLLYLFFAEYLKRNSFALVQNYSKGEEYVWKQMISPRGLALDSFKKEYARQRKKRKEAAPEKPQSRLKSVKNIARTTFLITSLFLCSAYLFSNNSKSAVIVKQQQSSEDSLRQEEKKSWKTELYSNVSGMISQIHSEKKNARF